jgi:hypothetical protein
MKKILEMWDARHEAARVILDETITLLGRASCKGKRRKQLLSEETALREKISVINAMRTELRENEENSSSVNLSLSELNALAANHQMNRDYARDCRWTQNHLIEKRKDKFEYPEKMEALKKQWLYYDELYKRYDKRLRFFRKIIKQQNLEK